ncbi:MAG: hypothetical protein HY703_05505 [Gemmatimonadetes bacterium]|nr:hypothetical protein [Gemmatimonadota bacterium]
MSRRRGRGTGSRGARRAAGPAAPVAAGADHRVEAVERLLRDRGLEGVRVTAAGHEREIAALETAAPHLAKLARLAPEIKALGFRYVAVDLAAARQAGTGDGR